MGAEATVISLNIGEIKAWNEKDWGRTVRVDQTLDPVDPSQFAALVLPGGVINADKISTDPKRCRSQRVFSKRGSQ